MFSISHKAKILRASLFGVVVSSILFIIGFLVINKINHNVEAVISPTTTDGQDSTIVANDKIYYDSWGTNDFEIKSNGETFHAYCANPKLQTPEGVYQAILFGNSEAGNLIKLMMYINDNNNSYTASLKTEIFRDFNITSDEKYIAYAHAIIGAIYDEDYVGLTEAHIAAVNRAIGLLRGYISNDVDAWAVAKTYTLFRTEGGALQDIVWIEGPDVVHGNLKVQKCDGTSNLCTPQGNASFSGIEFAVYNNSGSKIYNDANNTIYANGAEVARATTNASGEVSFNNLAAGSYRVVETATNASYQLTAGAKTATISTEGQNTELKFYNNAVLGRVSVTKKDSSTGNCTTVGNASFNGVSFSITNNSTNPVYYNGNSYAHGAVIATKPLDTSTCGVVFSDLPYGSYIVKETVSGTGYQVSTASNTVTIPTNNSVNVTTSFTNTAILGKITVTKKDSLTGTCTTVGNASFSTVKFSITNNSTNPVIYNGTSYAKGAVMDTKTFNASTCGVVFENLPYGSYIIKETVAGTGYNVNTAENTVTIPTNNNVNVTTSFTNTATTGSITVNKTDSATGTCTTVGNASFSGVRFSITNNSTNPVYYNGTSYVKGAVIDTKALGSNCQATFTGLPYGSYIVKEVSAGTGYQVNNTEKTITIPTNNNVNVTTSYTNTAILGKITVTKKDSLTGTCTTVGNASFSTVKFSITNNSTNPVIYNGTSYAKGAVMDTKTFNASTCGVVFENLPYGSYIIKETVAGTGYNVNTAVNTVTIPTEDSVNVTTNFTNVPVTGSITVIKKDSMTNSCATVGNASFSSVRFTITNNSTNPVVYSGVSYNKGAVMDTKGVDSNCRATFTGLPYGSYIIKEVAAGTGYNRNTIEKVVTIPTDDDLSIEAEFTNDPILGKLTVNKTDAATGTCKNSFGLSFAGTRIQLKNNSTNPIYYNGNPVAKGAVIATKELAEGDCSVEFTNLPYGSYIVKEVAAGRGYALDSTERVVTIPTNNSVNISTTVVNKPIRGDVKFVKKDSDNDTLLSNTVFSISSIDEDFNILETHIVVTNEDGIVDTSSSFIPHSTNTNGYDALYDELDPIVFSGFGTWFGRDADGNALPVSDNLGALPYGRYIIQELKCGANLFCYGVLNQKVTITINTPNQIVNLGDWDNDCAVFSLGTTASDAEDGDKIIEVSKETKIKDTISYCVRTDLDFTIKGILMDKATGEPLLIDDKTIEEEIRINSDEECGEAEMIFTFDGTKLAGREVVVFESLYYENELIVSHNDLDDAEQTVELVEFHTFAKNRATGKKNLPLNEDVEIEDTVYYCLVAGNEYTIKGVLMNKATKAPITVDGKALEQSVTITPEESCGEVKMIYKLNTSDLGGAELVIFESLYRDDELLIAHEDYENVDETVTVDLPAPNTGNFTGEANGSKMNYMLVGSSIFILVGVAGYFGMRATARKKFFKN